MAESLLDNLIVNDQAVYLYCDNDGNTPNEFPINPNGSLYNLAAVCNNRGNIMAMMPHRKNGKWRSNLFVYERIYSNG